MMLKAEDFRELRALFLNCDTNNDGQISLGELQSHLGEIAGHFHVTEAEVLQMMRAADVNGDGYIDYAEFVSAAIDTTKLLTEPNLETAFKIFDTNGDGSISRAEL